MNESLSAPPKKRSPLPTILIITACVIIVLLVAAYLVKDTINYSTAKMGELLTVGKLETSFQLATAQFEDTQRLQLQTVTANEVITQKDSAEILNIELPDVIIEARVPVEYTYYVDLKGDWNFSVDDTTQKIQVACPQIEFNTPAVAFTEIEFVERDTSALRNEKLAVERLKRDLPGHLKSKAAKNIATIKDRSRTQIAEFVRSWVLREFPDAKPYRIDVYFSDENEPSVLKSENKKRD